MICTFFDVFGCFLPRPVLHTHPFAVSNKPARPYAADKRRKFNDHVQTTYYRIVWDIVDALWHQEFQHTIKTTLDFAGKLKNRTVEDWRRRDRVSARIMLLRCSKKYPWMKRSVTSRDGHILYQIYQHHKRSRLTVHHSRFSANDPWVESPKEPFWASTENSIKIWIAAVRGSLLKVH